MAGIKGKNTKPEIIVRKILFSKGYRFRINKKIGNSKPDIIIPKLNLCIFVHGCFWHQHQGCKYSTVPKSNKSFWKNKFQDTLKRDKRNLEELEQNGWHTEVIWECQTKNNDLISLIIKDIIEKDGPSQSCNKQLR